MFLEQVEVKVEYFGKAEVEVELFRGQLFLKPYSI